MNWTTEKPTAPGWYWYRAAEADVRIWYGFRAGEKLIVSISDETPRYVSFSGSDYDRSLDELTGEFAGPIPEPS